jgi:hypothetical protein
MAFYNQKTIPYVLIDEKERRRGAFKMPHLPTFDDKEIDNLLIRFDKDEPSASVGTTQKPASNPAAIPQISETVSQPQTSDKSPAQPVQSILEEKSEGFTLPSLGGYLNQATEKVSQTQETIGAASGAIDQIKIIKDALDTRTDSLKSLWTFVSQIVWQPVWAVGAFFIGLPREMWLVVAGIGALVAIYYLYRQISLGKLRETARLRLIELANLF